MAVRDREQSTSTLSRACGRREGKSGPELGVRYALRGSVRRSNRRLRIVVQLADASHGRHIWSDRFEGDLDDVFAIQDSVTAQVSGFIAPALQIVEIDRAQRKPTGEPDRLRPLSARRATLPDQSRRITGRPSGYCARPSRSIRLTALPTASRRAAINFRSC